MELAEYLNLTFVDHNFEVVRAYSQAFSKINGCKFQHDNIFRVGPGTLVSPANSHGDMNDGIDRDYKEKFEGIEGRLANFIGNIHAGKLEVGKAQIVPTHDKNHPYIVFAPTVERFGDASSEENVRLATKAILMEVLKFNKKPEGRGIARLLIPGLGTGCAGLFPEESARGVIQGYKEINERYLASEGHLEY